MANAISKIINDISIINSSGNNKIHWAKTINKAQPIIQDGCPCYVDFKNKNKRMIKLGKSLLITEKPSVAMEFAKALKITTKRNTFRIRR